MKVVDSSQRILEKANAPLRLPGHAGGTSAEFRRSSTLGVTAISLVVLAPFSVNNFLQGRAALGFGSLVIILVLALIVSKIVRGSYSERLTELTLVPMIIAFLVASTHWQGMIGVLWCFPAILAFYFMLPVRSAWIANGILVMLVLPLAFNRVELPVIIRVAAVLIAVSAFSALFVHVIAMQRRELHAYATTDSVTGLLNRRLLVPKLDQRVAEHKARVATEISLVIADLDDLKGLNDTHGHMLGDEVLTRVGQLIKASLGTGSEAFRYGGDEFLIVLTDTGLKDAQNYAEALREEIQGIEFQDGLKVTMSFGVTALGDREDWKSWLKRSDECLYRAKRDGKNRVATG